MEVVMVVVVIVVVLVSIRLYVVGKAMVSALLLEDLVDVVEMVLDMVVRVVVG